MHQSCALPLTQAEKSVEIWDIWYPQAAATGLPFARSQIDAAQSVLVHSAPPVLTVQVRDGSGRLLALGENLEATREDNPPITMLTRRDDGVERNDLWPSQAEIGLIVLLPGGEAGTLKAWWHAPDHSEWRWQVEFYNKR